MKGIAVSRYRSQILLPLLLEDFTMAGQKVPLDKAERPLYACGTVCIAAFMSDKTEPEALPEGFHFGHRNHLATRAAEHHHVRVVDHDPLGRTGEGAQCFGQKHLAIETLQGRIALEEQHA